MQYLGFNSEGKVTNYDRFGIISWEKLIEVSSKVLTFIDVGGNEK